MSQVEDTTTEVDDDAPVVSYDRAVKAYIKMREARSKLKRDFEIEDNKIKAQQELIEAFLLNVCNTTGLKNFATKYGTVIKSEDILPTGSDWDAFYHWVAENDAFDALERRIKKTFISQYMEEHKGSVPPGVSVLRSFKITIRRSNKES